MVNEVLTIIFSFLLGYLIDNSWARVVRGRHLERKNYKKLIVKKIRIHHNVIGYILVIIGFFYYPLILVSIGIGMIVGHGIRDRGLFWFVEKI